MATFVIVDFGNVAPGGWIKGDRPRFHKSVTTDDRPHALELARAIAEVDGKAGHMMLICEHVETVTKNASRKHSKGRGR